MIPNLKVHKPLLYKILLTYSRLMIFSVLTFYSCNSNTSGGGQPEDKTTLVKSESSPGSFKYDLQHPENKWVLPAQLKEISGISWIDKNHLLAIEDLHPNLYLLRLDNNQAAIEKTIPFSWKSDKKFDIEDVAVVNNTAYALWSHGAIFKITDWQHKADVKELNTFLTKENNTEGICYDPVSHNLLVACKNESDVSDESKSTRAIYEFDLSQEKLKETPFLVINKKDFKKVAGEKIDFFPSAIAVHPVTHDVYLLSTKDNKCMAQFTHGGTLQSVQFINKELLQQPEGICFAPDGALYISTEGKHGEPPYLYQYTSGK